MPATAVYVSFNLCEPKAATVSLHTADTVNVCQLCTEKSVFEEKQTKTGTNTGGSNTGHLLPLENGTCSRPRHFALRLPRLHAVAVFSNMCIKKLVGDKGIILPMN